MVKKSCKQCNLKVLFRDSQNAYRRGGICRKGMEKKMRALLHYILYICVSYIYNILLTGYRSGYPLSKVGERERKEQSGTRFISCETLWRGGSAVRKL